MSAPTDGTNLEDRDGVEGGEDVVDGMAGLAPDHFLHMLAVALGSDGEAVTGTAPVRPELFVPGTTRIRTALLLTMVDLVAGHTPDVPLAPTVDIRVQVHAPGPTSGTLLLRCRPLRVGRRMVVSETELLAGATGVPFARALSTFLTMPLGPGAAHGPRPVPPMPTASFDEFLGARVVDERRLELDPHPRLDNGHVGTVQGGVQSLLAELAAEHALGGGRRLVASDIDIRYLSRLAVGPLAATVEPVPSADGALNARVRLTDAGEGDRLVSYVSLTLSAAG
jgi:acyl-coenzyme A thioesterase PaaI-like protein